MKKVLFVVAWIVFAMFGLASFGLMSILSYSAVSRVFPGDAVKPLWGLAMFDVAAVVWLLVFAYKSEGVQQRGAAFVNFLVAALGSLVLVGLEVALSGGVSDAAGLAQWIVFLFIGQTAVNVIGVYAHHILDPDVVDEIEMRVDFDAVVQEARLQAKRANLRNLQAMGAMIAARYSDALRERLSLPVVLDASARDSVPDVNDLTGAVSVAVDDPADDQPQMEAAPEAPATFRRGES